MMIDIKYSFGSGPYTVGGEIDCIPFEMTYFYGSAYLIVLTENFVLRTECGYTPETEKLPVLMLGQLIYSLAIKLDSEL